MTKGFSLWNMDIDFSLFWCMDLLLSIITHSCFHRDDILTTKVLIMPCVDGIRCMNSLFTLLVLSFRAFSPVYFRNTLYPSTDIHIVSLS